MWGGPGKLFYQVPDGKLNWFVQICSKSFKAQSKTQNPAASSLPESYHWAGTQGPGRERAYIVCGKAQYQLRLFAKDLSNLKDMKLPYWVLCFSFLSFILLSLWVPLQFPGVAYAFHIMREVIKAWYHSKRVNVTTFPCHSAPKHLLFHLYVFCNPVIWEGSTSHMWVCSRESFEISGNLWRDVKR